MSEVRERVLLGEGMYGRGKLYGREKFVCKGFTQILHKFTCAVKEGNVQRPACVPLVLTRQRDGGRRTRHVVDGQGCIAGTVVPVYSLWAIL